MKYNLTLENRMFGNYGTLTPEEDKDIKVFLSYSPYARIHYHLLTISDQAYPRDILPIAEEALIECAFCRKIGGYRCLTEAAAKVCPDAQHNHIPIERKSMRGRDDYAV